jgi:site-specific DNA-methyltransferase (adenine-specific)
MNSLAPRSVDLAFADPPFNIGYDYDVYNDRQERDSYLSWSHKWIAAVHRVLKPDGTFWLAIGDEYAAELKIASQEVGFHARSWVIWYYTFGVNCKYKFTRSHAHLFYFVKDPAKFTFRAEELENRIPSARQLVYNDARSNSIGRLPDDTWILRPQDLMDGFAASEDTWYIPRVAGTFKERAGFHGCQMPEQLLGRIIRICSQPGELVLDPFSGSATTLAVAKKLGRRYVGFDLSPEYVQRGTDRLASIKVGDRLDGDPEPLMTAPKTLAYTPPGGKGKGVKKAEKVNEVYSKAEAGADQRSSELVHSSLIAAFAEACAGYSADRVVADPELAEKFIAACRTRELPGGPRDWNGLLFNLRKAGKLKSVETTRRTELAWEEFDEISCAAEIALQQMLMPAAEGGCEAGSLDQILCDPELTAEFDRRAQRFLPGKNAFVYRWAALKLRKEVKNARTRAQTLQLGRFGDSTELCRLPAKKFPETSGLFIVEADKHKLYVGEALNLRSRIETTFHEDALEAWQSLAPDAQGELSLRYWKAEGDIPQLLGYQSKFIDKLKPRFNFREMATK